METLISKILISLNLLSVALASLPSNNIAITPQITLQSEVLGVLGAIYKHFPPEKVDTALKIASCESRLKNIPNYLYDGENGKFTAYGPFQITKSTALEIDPNLDRRKIEDNVKLAVSLFQRGELWRWNSSKDCWDK